MPSTPASTTKVAAAVKNAKSAEALLGKLEAAQKRDLPEVRSGATVAVHAKVIEKGKVRTQIFEGMVIKSVRRAKLGASIVVRKVASGIGVERTFFLHSPLIEKVEVKKQAKVRRAKLYYMRSLSGRAASQQEEEVAKPAKVSRGAK
jgi:large subunit ribosomal protein L19